MTRGRVTRLVLVVSLASAAAAGGQDLEVHGFLQANYSARVADTGPGDPPDDFLLGDHRLQLDLGRSSGAVTFGTKVDLVHDAVAAEAAVDVREAHITVRGDRYDVTVGRQVLTWGVGDLVFINDLFTKDWTALIAGQPLQYLKLGSDGVSATVYLEGLSAQVVAIPFFEADRLPRGDRLVGYTPAPGLSIVTERPDRTVGNTELAARVFGYAGGFDVAAYVYRGFWGAPPGIRQAPDRLIWFAPELAAYGASVQGTAAGGIVSGEAGYYDSRQDPDGLDPTVENSQLRLLAGYQRAFGSDVTVGAQYYAERMLDHEAYLGTVPAGFPRRGRTRHNLTARLTRTFNYQTSQVSVFVWVSPDEEDAYINPEVRHALNDDVWVAVGGNLFAGAESHTFFGQFDRNDNLYATARFTF